MYVGGNASGQAKDNAEAIFDGDEPEAQFSPSEAEADLDYAPGESIGEDIQHGGETNRVLGGYKATLKSTYLSNSFSHLVVLMLLFLDPRVSDQAKQHAQDMLDEAYNWADNIWLISTNNFAQRSQQKALNIR